MPEVDYKSDVTYYGAAGDGVRDDSAAIQRALDSIVASGKPGVVRFPGAVYKVNSPLEWDASYVKLDLEGATLDFSGLTTDIAIDAIGTVYPPYKQAAQGIETGYIIGPGKAGSATGIRLLGLEAGPGEGPSHLNLPGVSIRNFGTGIAYSHHAYLNNFFGCDIFNCGTCISAPGGLTDAGERLTFVGCNMFNSNLAVNVAGPEVMLLACSLDYNLQQAIVSAGKLNLIGCHVESHRNTHSVAPFALSGNASILYMMGGTLIMVGSAAPTAPAIVSLTGITIGQGGAFFRGVNMQGLRTSGDLFYTGNSAISVEEGIAFDIGNTLLPGSPKWERPYSTQALTAGTAISVALNATKKISATAPITITAVPTMGDGFDGQVARLVNVGSNAITIQDQGTLAGSNLRLTAATLAIGPRQSVQLEYMAAIGDWVQITPLVAVL